MSSASLRLLAAPLAELADLAVLVEHQPRRLAARLEPLDLVQHLLRLAVELRVQPDLAQPASGPRATSPTAGRSPCTRARTSPSTASSNFCCRPTLSPWLCRTGR